MARTSLLLSLFVVAVTPLVFTMCAPREACLEPPVATVRIACPDCASAPRPPVSVASAAPPPPEDSAPIALPAGDAEGVSTWILSSNGDLFAGGRRITNDDDALATARLARDQNPDVRAVIKADRTVQHGKVIHVLDLLKQAGITKIAFGVSPEPPAGPSHAPPAQGPLPKTCAGLEASIEHAFAARGCRSAADCTSRSVYCGCPRPLMASAAGTVDALNQAFSDRNCQNQGTPRPCATCAAPPIPVCVAGACVTRQGP